MSKTYKYGMRLQGFSPGAQPADGLMYAEDGADKVLEYGRLYHSIFVYDRPLTAEEHREYELDDLNGIPEWRTKNEHD